MHLCNVGSEEGPGQSGCILDVADDLLSFDLTNLRAEDTNDSVRIITPILPANSKLSAQITELKY